jgi:hypothetical protein
MCRADILVFGVFISKNQKKALNHLKMFSKTVVADSFYAV